MGFKMHFIVLAAVCLQVCYYQHLFLRKTKIKSLQHQLCFSSVLVLLNGNQTIGESTETIKLLQYPYVIPKTTRDFLRSIPNVDPQKIQPLADAVNEYVKGLTSPTGSKESLVSFTSRFKLDFVLYPPFLFNFFWRQLELLFIGTNVTKDEQLEIFGPETDRMTDENFKKIEEKLHKKLTPEHAERILGIVQKFQLRTANALTDATVR